MPAKTSTKVRPAEPPIVADLQRAVGDGADWFPALLEAIARWEEAEETVEGRHYQYLIAGEAFDWLLLAERLCGAIDGAVPAAEREALLFFSRMPQRLEDDEFRRAIGDEKHAAHLNFIYGVAVEEALQLRVEEEVLKERRADVWKNGDGVRVDDQVFERIYGKSSDELLAAFREARALPAGDLISYGDHRAFTYWLFKYRVNQSDPARVASDTRKALAQVSALQDAARRREAFAKASQTNGGVVVEGEVVARVR
jgi:hypothetical protein